MKANRCSVSMPSACTPFASSTERHARVLSFPIRIGIHIPQSRWGEWKATAPLTDGPTYHNAGTGRQENQRLKIRTLDSCVDMAFNVRPLVAATALGR